ncbi:hypothetical protein ACJJTC_014647 [Scirpophaga incertulas]
MVLTLYKRDTSPPCRSVFMTLHALGITDVVYVDVDLPGGEHLTEEYIRMNPQHTIPLLKDDEFIIWDSHAICFYLVEKYGKDNKLYPAELKQRAVIHQRLHFNGEVLYNTLKNTVVLPVIYGTDKDFKPENMDKIKATYSTTEKLLTKKWLAGDDATLADICCVSTISSMNEICPIDNKEYPRVAQWLKNCSKQQFYTRGNIPYISLFLERVMRRLAENRSK